MLHLYTIHTHFLALQLLLISEELWEQALGWNQLVM